MMRGMNFQLVIDCADPSTLVRFWAEALDYRVPDPPRPFATWRDYYLDLGVPGEELTDGDCADRLADPKGAGPDIWFQIVPERKTIKNRLHLDLRVSGGRSVPMATRRERVDAEVDRLVGLGATQVHTIPGEGLDHYAVLMNDPEGNEFCIA
jgi:hypothetical protein